MPYNCKGDLRKVEIVGKLQKAGFEIKSVNALNKLLENMEILVHHGRYWSTTDKGAKFSAFHKHVLNCEAWHPELVDEIINYLKNKT